MDYIELTVGQMGYLRGVEDFKKSCSFKIILRTPCMNQLDSKCQDTPPNNLHNLLKDITGKKKLENRLLIYVLS